MPFGRYATFCLDALEPISKLAMNGNEFAPDDGGASELNESEIIGSFLLKADE